MELHFLLLDAVVYFYSNSVNIADFSSSLCTYFDLICECFLGEFCCSLSLQFCCILICESRCHSLELLREFYVCACCVLTTVCANFIYTLCPEKTPTYVFNYNSDISWSIFVFFTSGNSNGYSTLSLFNGLMTS